MKLPYGEADFYSLVRGGYVYVDRTDYIRTLEEMGNALLFLRPRRFGKSLWLRTLSCYYDLRYRDEHEELFGGLVASDDTTAHRSFVLEWDFSVVAPELSPGKTLGELLNSYVNQTITNFLSDYRDHLPPSAAEDLRLSDVAVDNLEALLALLRRSGHGLVLLVDEYDNFANEVMLSDPESYRGLVRADGPYRALMKWVKQARKGKGLERIFFTGVSPVVMSDVTSGMNILTDVSQRPRLNDLCGFREDEVRQLLAALLAEMGTDLSAKEGLEMMRTWYNGYRFAVDARQKVYNPTLVLYFLDHLQEFGVFADDMVDANLAMDEEKLSHLARKVTGEQALMDIVQKDEPVELRRIEDSFSLDRMLSPGEHERSVFLSYLYYLGVLTLENGRTPQRTLLLSPPNLVTRKLFLDHVRRLLLAGEQDPNVAHGLSRKLLQEGDVAPLARYVEQTVFQRFSNLDYRWMNELAVKTAFLSLVFDDNSHVIWSEPELDRSRADVCLLRRMDARTEALWDVLLEFKYVKLSALPGRPSGRKLRELPEEDLLAMEPVREAFTEAEGQLADYESVLIERFGVSALRLRAFAVVALGLERLLVRETSDR